jgi:hypothetical protein
MFDPWTKLALQMASLAWDAQHVIALRMFRLANGGRHARKENGGHDRRKGKGHGRSPSRYRARIHSHDNQPVSQNLQGRSESVPKARKKKQKAALSPPLGAFFLAWRQRNGLTFLISPYPSLRH